MKRALCIFLTLVCLCPAAWEALAEPAENAAYYRIMEYLFGRDGQFVFSPASLEAALSMAAEGADGDTRSELLRALGLTETAPVDWAAYPQIQSANAAILSDSIVPLPAYLETLRVRYQAEMFPMAADVTEQVNRWARDRTGGMIDPLLEKPLDEETGLALLNALLLDAEWQRPFDPNQTKPGVFHSPEGDREAVFMEQSAPFAYAEADGTRMVTLPYKDASLEMLLILPPEGELASVLGRMGREGLGWLGSAPAPGEVWLKLPKLSLSSGIDMREVLTELGVTAPFSPDADFSGITGDRSLYVSAVEQKARLDVDERGTRAAAATAVVVSPKGLALDPVELTFDRPFLLLARDSVNGKILFAAAATQPRSPE